MRTRSIRGMSDTVFAAALAGIVIAGALLCYFVWKARFGSSPPESSGSSGGDPYRTSMVRAVRADGVWKVRVHFSKSVPQAITDMEVEATVVDSSVGGQYARATLKTPHDQYPFAEFDLDFESDCPTDSATMLQLQIKCTLRHAQPVMTVADTEIYDSRFVVTVPFPGFRGRGNE